MGIADELKRGLPGGLVITDPDLLESYRRDETALVTAGTPAVVVLPRETADVQHVLRVASAAGVPVVTQGSRSGLATLVDALVRDALALLEEVSRVELDEQAARTVALLALIAGQDVEPAPGSDGNDGNDGRWQIVGKVAKGRVISVVDPEARHAHKTVARKQDGFKAHLAVEPDTCIVTACELTKAAGEQAVDGTVGTKLLERDDTVTGPVEVLGDSAYGTGDALDQLDKAGHTPLVKPWPTRPAVEGGFTADDFTIDEQVGTATCPVGTTRSISRTRTVTFGAACRGCPFAAQCTTSKRSRKLTLHEHDALQRIHRQRAKDPQWQQTYRQHRPMVERSIAWTVAGGNRKVRYRGTAKNDAWLHTRTAALNLRRMLNLGLVRHQGAWAVA